MRRKGKEIKMEEAKVSIIVPVYNVEEYLKRCIQSIMQQTYSNLEILLIDDGSTDHSGAMCNEYANRDKRIRVIHKENGGLSDARNTGIEASTGEYLLFIDSDDYVDIHLVQSLLERLYYDNTDMVVCGIEKVDVEEHIITEPAWTLKDQTLSRKEYWQEFYKNSTVPYVVAWNKLYKKQLFKQIRYPRGKIHEDEFVIHKILAECNSISVVGKKLYYYVQRQNSIMNRGYDSRRLQVLEAFANRMDYFLEENQWDLAWKTIQRMRMVLCEAYQKMDVQQKQNQIAYRQGKRLHIQYVRKCCKNKIAWKQLSKVLIFCLSTKQYCRLVQSKHNTR